MATYNDAAMAVAIKLGAGRQEACIALVAWAGAENGWDGGDNHPRFNPWNTTLPWAGATDYFSDPSMPRVKNYPSFDAGVSATVATLQEKPYAGVLAAMRTGTAEQIAEAVTASPWGTEPFVTVVKAVRSNYTHYAGTTIAGSAVMLTPEFSPPFGPIAAAVKTSNPDGGVLLAGPDGAVYALFGAVYHGGANGHAYFAGRQVASIIAHPDSSYTLVATSGETYNYP